MEYIRNISAPFLKVVRLLRVNHSKERLKVANSWQEILKLLSDHCCYRSLKFTHSLIHSLFFGLTWYFFIFRYLYQYPYFFIFLFFNPSIYLSRYIFISPPLNYFYFSFSIFTLHVIFSSLFFPFAHFTAPSTSFLAPIN